MYYTKQDWDNTDNYLDQEEVQRQFVYFMMMDRVVRAKQQGAQVISKQVCAALWFFACAQLIQTDSLLLRAVVLFGGKCILA